MENYNLITISNDDMYSRQREMNGEKLYHSVCEVETYDTKTKKLNVVLAGQASSEINKLLKLLRQKNTAQIVFYFLCPIIPSAVIAKLQNSFWAFFIAYLALVALNAIFLGISQAVSKK